MSKEIIPSNHISIRPKRLSLTERILRRLFNRGERLVEEELQMSFDELKKRLEVIYQAILNDGDKTICLDKKKFCMLTINPNNNALEFRVGTKDQVNSNTFTGMNGIEKLIQVAFGSEGDVISAVSGDLDKQRNAVLGSHEYDLNGTVYGGVQYESSVDVFVRPSSTKDIRITNTDDFKKACLLEILRPVNNVVWRLTEELPVTVSKKDIPITIEVNNPT